VDKLNTEITTLQNRLNDLVAKEQQKEQLEAETEQFNQQFQEILKDYPADLNQENTVMFLKSVEEQNEFVNMSFSMPAPATFYKLGGGSNGVSNDALTGDNVEKDNPYYCITSAYGISYEGSYQGLKDVLAYVAGYRYRMNISNFNIAYNQDEDLCSGTLTLNGYAITGPDRTPATVDLGLETGTTNLFIAGDGSNKSSGGNKYDSDNGAGIVLSNNLVILLNSANSDLSSGIIVSSNSNREETYVTSSENSRQQLAINVYSEDGKNFIQYGIGTDAYTAEILSEDVAIYVKSSARVDNNDLNGVDVNLSNSTTIPVYFKVVDDDTASPRFKLTNRNGSVKVY
jgi:hypothetical protein